MRWIIQKNQPSSGLTPYSRILLALELEPWLKERARSNQQVGGQRKGSLNLAKADKLDVRSEIAAAAGFSPATVSKVKQLEMHALSLIKQALREGEVRIDRAFLWLKNPKMQLYQLRHHQSRRGIMREVDVLLRRHRLPHTAGEGQFDIQRIGSALAAMTPEQREAVFVAEVKIPVERLAALPGAAPGPDPPGRAPAMNSEHPPQPGIQEDRTSAEKRSSNSTRDQWDHPSERDDVRDKFHKVLMCRTPALGGAVYASAVGEKVFYYTCKTPCCPGCGNRGTQLWQREQWAMLPDIPFVGIILTMPKIFWPIFKAHRPLQHDLPALGAAVLQQWAWRRYRVRLCVIVIQHTFGGRLNYNPHLHIMASAGGLKPVEDRWVGSLKFDHGQIMSLWSFAVSRYLWRAYQNGLLQERSSPDEFSDFIDRQQLQDWNIHITPKMSKGYFLHYAGRYVRRLPISQKRILQVTEQEVVYEVKDTRQSNLAKTTILEKGPLHSSGVCGHALATCPGSVPALYALFRPAGSANEAANLSNRICSARPAPATPAPRLPWDKLSIKKHFWGGLHSSTPQAIECTG